MVTIKILEFMENSQLTVYCIEFIKMHFLTKNEENIVFSDF